jgi:hypothetical protein
MPVGDPAYQLQEDPRPRVRGRRGRTRDASMVSPSEGNEVTGGRESQCPIVPLSQGNQPEGPWGGNGDTVSCTADGKHAGYIETRAMSTQRRRIALVAKSCDDEPDAPSTSPSRSVGARGGAIPLGDPALRAPRTPERPDLRCRDRRDRRARVGGIGGRMKCERHDASRRCFGVGIGMAHCRLAPGRSRRSRIETPVPAAFRSV